MYLIPTSSECLLHEKGKAIQKYVRPNVCVTVADRRRIIIDLVRNATNVFQTHQIDYVLDSGTLLGAYRNEKVIPWDEDADLGLTTDGVEYLRTHRVALEDDYTFQIFRSKIWDKRSDNSIPGRFVHTKSGVFIDLFEYISSQGKDGQRMMGPLPSRAWHNCHACTGHQKTAEFKVPQEWFFPSKECLFEGKQVQCPAQTEKVLEHLYGPTFMQPPTPLMNKVIAWAGFFFLLCVLIKGRYRYQHGEDYTMSTKKP